MGIGPFFIPVHYATLANVFPQQSIHLSLVALLLFSPLYPLLVSLPVQASLRSLVPLSPQCS